MNHIVSHCSFQHEEGFFEVQVRVLAKLLRNRYVLSFNTAVVTSCIVFLAVITDNGGFEVELLELNFGKLEGIFFTPVELHLMVTIAIGFNVDWTHLRVEGKPLEVHSAC